MKPENRKSFCIFTLSKTTTKMTPQGIKTPTKHSTLYLRNYKDVYVSEKPKKEKKLNHFHPSRDMFQN